MITIGKRLMICSISITATAVPSHADAPWSCAVSHRVLGLSVTRYQVVGNELRDLSSGKLMREIGVPDALGLSYNILQHTPFGIVAAMSQAISPDRSNVSVWAKIILINKKTGAMRQLSFSTEKGTPDELASGQCEQE